MGRETIKATLLAVFGVAAGLPLTIVFTEHPTWSSPLLVGSALICVLCLAAFVVVCISPRPDRENHPMSGQRKSIGIKIEGGTNITLANNTGDGLGTLIEARNVKDMRAFGNSATNSDKLMDLKDVEGIQAWDNAHVNPESAQVQKPKAGRRYFSGWRRPKDSES